MAASFFFYDLETSGISPRSSRVMQFAGQRTDLNLKPVGEPLNALIKLTPDILPDPDAILLTGITPQKTIAEGVSEAEFLKLFYEVAVQPGTIFVGFNSVRFDDEFMRFMLYRNFYDAYEWQWKDERSRWDLLDMVRMTRALRPEGINWPFDSEGKPANRLEMLTQLNKIEHSGAHDALADVKATMAVAKLIKDKHPELFDYLLNLRSKKAVAKLVESQEPFIYTSSHYPSSQLHTTAVVKLASHPQSDAALVYDLRYDPTPFMKMTVDELAVAWQFTKDPDAVRLPVKTLKYNRVPAVAPLGVIKDKATQERLNLDLEIITKNLSILKHGQTDFAKKILEVVAKLDEARSLNQAAMVDNQLTVDERLYDSFIPKHDAIYMARVRQAEPDKLADFSERFEDPRLTSLLPLYKARNFPKSLTSEEQANWEAFCQKRLISSGENSWMSQYFVRLQELTKTKLNGQQKFLVEELELYGQSIAPLDEAAALGV